MMEVAIYAVVAFFIFFRLYLALGKSMNGEGFRNPEKIIDVIEEKNVVEDTFSSVSAENYAKIKEISTIIKGYNPHFSTDKFIKNAEIAFEVILNAFYDEDIKSLRGLLTKDVLNKFVAQIDKRKNSDNAKFKNVIISVDVKEIIDMEIVKNEVFITVRFVSKQIKSFDAINDGTSTSSPQSIKKEQVDDIWVFVKKISSSDPKWLLSDVR